MQKTNLVLILLCCFQFSFAQQREVYNTAAHFLIVNPDARSNAMGQVSTVSSSNYPGMGLFGNPALLNQGERTFGLQFSYMPILLRNDYFETGQTPSLSAYNAGGYYSINNRLTLAYNYHQFDGNQIMVSYSMGSVALISAREQSHNMRASYALSDKISVGVGAKYFRSYQIEDNRIMPQGYSDLTSYAFDAGFLYNNQLSLFKSDANWQAGAHIENLGPKASYGKFGQGPIPSRFNLGLLLNLPVLSGTFTNMELDLTYQTQRLLVPYSEHSSTAFNSIMRGVGDMFDPGQAYRFAQLTGAELRNSFTNDFHVALRAGYDYRNPRSVRAKHLTYGLGCGFKMVHFDIFHAVSLTRSENKMGISAGAKFNLAANN